LSVPIGQIAELQRLEQTPPAAQMGRHKRWLMCRMRLIWIFVTAVTTGGLLTLYMIDPSFRLSGGGFLAVLTMLVSLFLIREERTHRASTSTQHFLWHRLRDLSQIFEVVLSAKTEEDLRLLSGLGLQETMLLLRAEYGAIVQHTADQEDYVAVLGFDDMPVDHRPWLVELQSMLSGLKANTPVFVPDIKRDIHFRNARMMIKAGYHSFAAVKFSTRDRVEGLLVIGSPREREFQVGDDKTLELSARQIGSIAMHGRNLEESGERILELERENDRLMCSNQLKSEFASVASHELKTPLTAVKASVDTLLSNVRSGDYRDLEEFLLMIREEADHLIVMTHKILESSEQDFGNRLMERRSVHPRRVVDSCVKALEVHLQEKDMQLEISMPPELPDVFADPGMIRQVLINLISNAVKFSKSGQTITVGVELKDEFVEIRIVDRGSGIPLEEQPRVFDRFYQGSRREDVHAQGSGLGLAIVKQIIEQHDGRIKVESVPDKGSVFIFTLPVARGRFGLEGSVLDMQPQGEVEEFLHLSVDWIAFVARSDSAVFYLAKNEALALYCATENTPRDELAADVAMRAYSMDGSLISTHQEGPGVYLAVALEFRGKAVGSFVVGRAEAAFADEDLLLLEGIVARVGRVLTHASEQKDAGKILRRAMRAVRDLLQTSNKRLPPRADPGLLAWDLSDRLGANRELAKDIRMATNFHDVAMAQFGTDIGNEPRSLSIAEREKLRDHPRLAARLLEDIQAMEEVSRIVLYHHEWYNGEGYPEGLVGKKIPLGARMLAVIDAYCSMTAPRKYRPVRETQEAAQELVRCSGTQFDPEIIDHFLELLADKGWIDAAAVAQIKGRNGSESMELEPQAPNPSVVGAIADNPGEDRPF
jgi:signal transduction histidine kinase